MFGKYIKNARHSIVQFICKYTCDLWIEKNEFLQKFEVVCRTIKWITFEIERLTFYNNMLVKCIKIYSWFLMWTYFIIIIIVIRLWSCIIIRGQICIFLESLKYPVSMIFKKDKIFFWKARYMTLYVLKR